MDSPNRIAQAARQRADASRDRRRDARRIVRSNPLTPWKAEGDVVRQARFAARFRNGAESTSGAETYFQPVVFLDQGRQVSRAVGLIKVGNKVASGFLVTPQLLLTNHHVIGSIDEAKNAIVEFRY